MSGAPSTAISCAMSCIHRVQQAPESDAGKLFGQAMSFLLPTAHPQSPLLLLCNAHGPCCTVLCVASASCRSAMLLRIAPNPLPSAANRHPMHMHTQHAIVCSTLGQAACGRCSPAHISQAPHALMGPGVVEVDARCNGIQGAPVVTLQQTNCCVSNLTRLHNTREGERSQL